MVTTGFRYRTQGFVGYRHLRTEFREGEVYHHVELKPECRRCGHNGVFISAFEAQIGILGVALDQSSALKIPTDAPSDRVGKGGELGTRPRLHPAKPQRSVGAFDVDAIETSIALPRPLRTPWRGH